MSKAFDILMKKAFNEDINVTRSQADNYFKAISKYFNGDGGYTINGKHNVTINTKDFGSIQLRFTEGKDMKSIKVDSVTVNGKTEKVSKEINSIKDVPSLFQGMDILFGGRVKGSKPSSSSSSNGKKYKPKTREELKKLCDNLSINLGDIDTSLITDMEDIFNRSKRTNEQFKGIETWDVSNVENMNGMFHKSHEFNQPLNSWDVSNVKDMAYMFLGTSFNQPLDKWDVSKVTNMRLMFLGAESFNQPIGNWDVSNVKDMTSMFSGAKSFNQPLDKWDVNKVEDMRWMFAGAKDFNQDISMWSLRSQPDVRSMFEGCLIKEEYKPKKFKNNESYQGVTMSTTVFGELLYRSDEGFLRDTFNKIKNKITGAFDLYENRNDPQLEEKIDSLKNWSENLLYKGKSLFHIVYDSSESEKISEEVMQELADGASSFGSSKYHEEIREEYRVDQECYLGYSPSNDMFYIGFDGLITSYEKVEDEDGEEDEDVHELPAYYVLRFKIVDHKITDVEEYGMDSYRFYQRRGGHDYLKDRVKDIVDIRLD